MLQAVWQFFNTNASGIQAIAVIIVLTYAAIQTHQIGKQLRLAAITTSSMHFKELSKMVLDNEKVAKLFDVQSNDDLGEFAAAVVIQTFETRFLLHEAHLLLDEKMWEADQISMTKNFERYPFLVQAWRKYENEYYKPFHDFINERILLQVKPKPSAQQPH